MFKELSKAAKSGDAKPKHLNKLIAFCEEHKLKVHPAVRELAKTAAYHEGTDFEAEDFEDEDESGDLSEDESNLIKKTMRKIWNSEDFQEKLKLAIEPVELSTELAEETAIEMDHPEWLDDPDHEVWTLANEILDLSNENEGEEDENEFAEEDRMLERASRGGSYDGGGYGWSE